MRDELQRELKKTEERAERALHKLQLVREGLVDEVLLRHPAQRSIYNLALWSQAADEGRGIPFHLPATQQYRPSTLDGRTTFTFRFSSVTKLAPKGRKKGRVKLACGQTARTKKQRQSKPVEHAAYIERSDAVALSVARLPTGLQIPSIDEVKEHAHVNRIIYAKLANVIFDRPVHELDVDFAGGAGRPISDGSSYALPDLPGGEVDRARGGPAEGRVPPDEGVGGGERDADQAVRWVASEPGASLKQFLNAPVSGAVMEDWYIDRPGAVAVQPDGSRALLTNIDPDPAKRAEFWQLVEEHERESKPDRMSARFANAPDFWKQAVSAQDCPQALRAAYSAVDHAKVAEFEIDSVSEMRKFLEAQPGWVVHHRSQRFLQRRYRRRRGDRSPPRSDRF